VRERVYEKAHVFGLEQWRGLLVHQGRGKRLDPIHPSHKPRNPCLC